MSPAARPHEREEHFFEIEILTTRGTFRDVLPDLLRHRGRELSVEVLVEVFFAFPTVHVAFPLMYPIPTAYSYSFCCSRRRARNSRDFTVPTGTSRMRAISSYDIPSTSLNTTVSRNCSGSASMARRTSSSTMRSKKVPCGSSSWISSNTEKGSIASMSTVSGWRVRRRYSLMKACRRMVSSQPLAFVPFSNWCQARYALSMVSWTRSSASAGLPVSRSATRYRLSRWISASRSKLARFSASAAGVEAGGGGDGERGGTGGVMVCRNLSPCARVPQWGGCVL